MIYSKMIECFWSQVINDEATTIEKVEYDEPHSLTTLTLTCRNNIIVFKIIGNNYSTLTDLDIAINDNYATILNLVITRLPQD